MHHQATRRSGAASDDEVQVAWIANRRHEFIVVVEPHLEWPAPRAGFAAPDTAAPDLPQAAPGTLTPSQSADTVAFILSANQFPAGTMELASSVEALNGVKFAEPVQ